MVFSSTDRQTLKNIDQRTVQIMADLAALRDAVDSIVAVGGDALAVIGALKAEKATLEARVAVLVAEVQAGAATQAEVDEVTAALVAKAAELRAAVAELAA